MSSSSDEVAEAIIDLYMNVKVRPNDEIQGYDESKSQMERDKLKTINSMTVLKYIQQSIEILMNIR